jgi:hypothetical protein
LPDEYVALSIKVPRSLEKRIQYVAFKSEEKTGFRLSKTAVIRALLEEALTTRGIPHNVQPQSSDPPG